MAIVSFETVAAAAEALQADGQRPSVRAVIATLGGGSPNAVLKHLAEWKAGRPQVAVPDANLDPRIANAIVDQMRRVAAEASNAAEERAAGVEEDLQALAEAQQALERQIETVTGERDACRLQAEELAGRLAEAQAGFDREREQHVLAVVALREELATERLRQERASAALAKAEVRLEAIPSLQAETERLRTALESAQHARQQAEQNAAVLAAKLEAGDIHAAEVEAREQAALARAGEAERQARDAQMEARKSGEEAAELRGRLATAEQAKAGGKAKA
jgi:colicin import membrane protein